MLSHFVLRSSCIGNPLITGCGAVSCPLVLRVSLKNPTTWNFVNSAAEARIGAGIISAVTRSDSAEVVRADIHSPTPSANALRSIVGCRVFACRAETTVRMPHTGLAIKAYSN